MGQSQPSVRRPLEDPHPLLCEQFVNLVEAVPAVPVPRGAFDMLDGSANRRRIQDFREEIDEGLDTRNAVAVVVIGEVSYGAVAELPAAKAVSSVISRAAP